MTKLNVEQKLKLETLRRGANGALAQIILLMILFNYTPDFLYVKFYQVTVIGLILIFGFRWFIYHRFKKEPLVLVLNYGWSLPLGLFTSVLWVVINGLAIWHFRITHQVGLIHILVTCGLLAAVMYSLSPIPKVQKFYVLTLGLAISAILFIRESEGGMNFGITLLIFTLYLAFASKNHSGDLRSAYELENRLIAENEKLQDVVDSVPGFMIIVGTDGTWLHATKMMELGNTPELKEEIDDFLHSGLLTRTKEFDFKMAGENSFVLKFVKRSSGSVVVLGIPIGEIKHMRQELDAQKSKAEYSARLAALGEIAGGVAHEINNPLSVIAMSAEMLARKLKGVTPEKLWSSHIDKISETVRRITLIIKSLQNLSRESFGSSAGSVDITQIVEDTLSLCLEKFRQRGIEIDYKNPGELMVQGNNVEIGQVMINIINNAYYAVKDAPKKKVSLEFLETSEFVHLYIKDSGPGVSESVQDKMFLPFYTTKPFGEGSGLGLSISRSLLLKLGGEIQLVNAKDPTIFRISLPREIDYSIYKSH